MKGPAIVGLSCRRFPVALGRARRVAGGAGGSRRPFVYVHCVRYAVNDRGRDAATRVDCGLQEWTQFESVAAADAACGDDAGSDLDCRECPDGAGHAAAHEVVANLDDTAG